MTKYVVRMLNVLNPEEATTDETRRPWTVFAMTDDETPPYQTCETWKEAERLATVLRRKRELARAGRTFRDGESLVPWADAEHDLAHGTVYFDQPDFDVVVTLTVREW